MLESFPHPPPSPVHLGSLPLVILVSPVVVPRPTTAVCRPITVLPAVVSRRRLQLPVVSVEFPVLLSPVQLSSFPLKITVASLVAVQRPRIPALPSIVSWRIHQPPVIPRRIRRLLVISRRINRSPIISGEFPCSLSPIHLSSFPLAIALASSVVIWRPTTAMCAPIPVLPSVVSRRTRRSPVVPRTLISAATPIVVPSIARYIRIHVTSPSWRPATPWSPVSVWIVPPGWWSRRRAPIPLPCWTPLVAEARAVGAISTVSLAIEASSGSVCVRSEADSPALGRGRQVGFAVVELSTVQLVTLLVCWNFMGL